MPVVAAPQCDLSVLLQQLDGDREVARELARIFVLRFPDNMGELDSALETQQAEPLRRVAHQIKGVCALFAARACVARAQRIEVLAAEGDLAAAMDEGHELRQVLNLMLGEIEAFAQGDA